MTDIVAVYDVLVIGCGPGGFAAATQASQAGLHTACVDQRASLGGTYLVDGAVPSKTLLDESYFYRLLQQHELVEQRGVRLPPARLNMQAAQAALKGNIERLGKVYKSELSKYNVTVYKGTAAFKTPHRVEIAQHGEGGLIVEAKYIIVATGSAIVQCPGVAIDGTMVVSSSEALSLDYVPPRFSIMGGGTIGLEIACIFNNFGSRVTIIESQSEDLPEYGCRAGVRHQEAFAVSRNCVPLGHPSAMRGEGRRRSTKCHVVGQTIEKNLRASV